MLRVCALTVSVVVWLVASAVADTGKPGASGNPDLDEARTAIEKVNFDDGLKALNRALRRGDNPPERLVQIYQLLGEVYVSVGKIEDAKVYFSRLLMLRPYAKLSPGASPKLTTVLEQARRSLQNRGTFHVSASGDRSGGTVSLTRESDPLKLVARIRVDFVRAATGQTENRTSKPGTYVVQLPAQSLRHIVLIALDEWGNHLRVFQLGNSAVSPRRVPIWRRWSSWAVASGAFFLAGTVAGLAARSAQDDLDALRANSSDHFFGEFERVRSRGKRNALIANVALVFATASAATGVYLFLKQRKRAREKPAEKPAVVAVPVVGRGSAGLGLSGTF